MLKIGRDFLSGVVYTAYDEERGPIARAWTPENLTHDVKSLVAVKTLHFLSGEEATIPRSIEIFPFPSLKLKGLVKFIQKADKSYRGGISNSALCVLFKEEDDLVFYKSIKYFEDIFEKSAKTIAKEGISDPEITRELQTLQDKVIIILNDLHDEEYKNRKMEAFPDLHSGDKTRSTTFQYKLIVCGDPEVGKTSIILKFTDAAFRRTYIPTMGVNVSEKDVNYGTERVRFVIWDIAGQKKFQKMRKHFYTDAAGLFLVCDLTRPKTLEHLRDWHADIKKVLKKDLKGMILCNKNDLEGKIKIDKSTVEKLGKQLHLKTVETSALTGENIKDAFQRLGRMILSEKKHVT